ncbi:hypothetical protein AVEN_190122-1 [Araneus ventricosus]|uniref:Uncharacterized protein n=1 Tax=Araneus ventricosus TaxID=182803 RepID=A0A4Y2S3T2_ARAVE|nr:hypothetical protein AVEN_148872-1 [Araneus ventricosus]GBN82854.1 hypothetical protein AVEN_65538-1 [Araneus ventricosus]GBN83529.1 hypothetical protein AVEN_223691-1 [Araneus ventricosus]GBN83534.1 hypothetical protein AVEN_190122-1 [Araneus ventricosus]
MSQGVKSFYRTEIAHPVIDTALNTIDERFKENELDIFRSLKDVTCSNPSKIIKIASVQKASETYDLDMEKNKGGDTNFSENVQKIHRLFARNIHGDNRTEEKMQFSC